MNVDELLHERAGTWRTPEVAAPDLDAALRRRDRRRAAGLVVALALTLVVAGSVWATLPGRSVPAIPAPVGSPTAGATTPLSMPSVTVPSREIAAAARLLIATRSRGTAPERVETTASTVGIVRRAGVVEVPGDVADDTGVWVLQLVGTFDCACSRPLGSEATRPVLRAVLDATTFSVLGSGTWDDPAALGEVGDIVFAGDVLAEQEADYDLAARIRGGLARSGAADLTSIDGVVTTLGQTQQVVFGHTTYPLSWTRVYVVRATGSFTCPDCTSMNADPSKPATVLLLVINASTGELGYRAVADNPVDLAGVGVPVEFDVTRFR